MCQRLPLANGASIFRAIPVRNRKHHMQSQFEQSQTVIIVIPFISNSDNYHSFYKQCKFIITSCNYKIYNYCENFHFNTSTPLLLTE